MASRVRDSGKPDPKNPVIEVLNISRDKSGLFSEFATKSEVKWTDLFYKSLRLNAVETLWVSTVRIKGEVVDGVVYAMVLSSNERSRLFQKDQEKIYLKSGLGVYELKHYVFPCGRQGFLPPREITFVSINGFYYAANLEDIAAVRQHYNIKGKVRKYGGNSWTFT